MSLIEEFMETFVIMDQRRVPDGASGFITQWLEGAEVQLALTLDTTLEARRASQEGMNSSFKVYMNTASALGFHDVVKRIRDGQTFRLTSDATDKHVPKSSSLDLCMATAQRWELTS